MIYTLKYNLQGLNQISYNLFYEAASKIYKHLDMDISELYECLHINKHGLWEFASLEVYTFITYQTHYFGTPDMIQERLHAGFYKKVSHDKVLLYGKNLLSLIFLQKGLQNNQQSSLKILMDYLFYNSNTFTEEDMVVLLNEAIHRDNPNVFSVICKFIKIIKMPLSLKNAMDIGAYYIRAYPYSSARLIRDLIISDHFKTIANLEIEEKFIMSELIKDMAKHKAQWKTIDICTSNAVIGVNKISQQTTLITKYIISIYNTEHSPFVLPIDVWSCMNYFINMRVTQVNLNEFYKSGALLNGPTFRLLCDLITISGYDIYIELDEVKNSSHDEPSYFLEAIIFFLAKHGCLVEFLIPVITLCLDKNAKEALTYVCYSIIHGCQSNYITANMAIDIIKLLNEYKHYELAIILEERFTRIPGYLNNPLSFK